MEAVKKTLGKVVQPIASIVDRSSGLVFVTAGNGAIGYRVAMRLLQTGYEDVRVGHSDPLNKERQDEAAETRSVDLETAAMDKIKDAGGMITDFSWDKEETYKAALEGVKTVFCSAPTRKDWDAHFAAFLRACKHAGVRHVVKLSFFHAMQGPDEPAGEFSHSKPSEDIFLKVPLVRIHRECDKRLMKSGLDYTILFATHFMSNPLRYQGMHLRTEGKFYGASGMKGVNYVSPNDVADVAVRCIVSPKDHYRKGYTLTGPKAITDMEVADRLTTAFNTKIEYVNQSASEFKDTNFAALELVKASGVEQKTGVVTKEINRICNHPAEPYDEYLLNKDAMSPHEQAAFLPA